MAAGSLPTFVCRFDELEDHGMRENGSGDSTSIGSCGVAPSRTRFADVSKRKHMEDQQRIDRTAVFSRCKTFVHRLRPTLGHDPEKPRAAGLKRLVRDFNVEQ
jgi:hypothetical protein